MKDIKTLSNTLNISKEAIYKKLNYSMRTELKNHNFKKEGKTYIDEIGESLILQSLRREKQDIITDATELEKEPDITDDITFKELNNELKEQVKIAEFINVLRGQLKEKDLQLERLTNHRDEQLNKKDEQIEQLLKINQSLVDTLQNEQKLKATQFLTDNSIKETDNEVAATMEQPPEAKKNFWDRILKR